MRDKLVPEDSSLLCVKRRKYFNHTVRQFKSYRHRISLCDLIFHFKVPHFSFYQTPELFSRYMEAVLSPLMASGNRILLYLNILAYPLSRSRSSGTYAQYIIYIMVLGHVLNADHTVNCQIDSDNASLPTAQTVADLCSISVYWGC